MKRIHKITGLFLILIINHLAFAQKDSSKATMKFDFGITRDQNITLWPFIRRINEENKKDLQIMYPIFRKQINLIDNSKKSHLFPLYWNYKDSVSSDKRFVSLYYPSLIRVKKDKEAGVNSFSFIELAPSIPLLEFSKSKDGLFVENNILFFLWAKNDVANQSSHLVCFPLYWSFKEKDKKEKILLPVQWKKEIYLTNDTIRTRYVFPLYWSYKDKNRSEKAFAFFMWQKENKYRKSFTILPLYSKGGRKDNSSNYLMLGSLYWRVKTDSGKDNVFIPIIWNRKRYHSYDTTNFAMVFPLYWSYKDHKKNSKVVFPLMWSLNNPRYKSFTLAPVVSAGHSKVSDSKHLMLSSVFWHFKNKHGKTTLAFPLYCNVKRNYLDDTTHFKTFFPLYWSYTDITTRNRTFIPIYWKFDNPWYKSLTIAPFYSRGFSKDSLNGYRMIALINWQTKSPRSKTGLTIPFYLKNEKYNQEDTSTFKTVFPFYWSYHDNRINNKVYFPIVWKIDNSIYKSFTLLPVYSQGISADSSRRHRMVALLHWKKKSSLGKTSLTIPIHYKREKYFEEDTTLFHMYFPFYWAYEDMEINNKVVFPFTWKFENSLYKSFTVPPFYSKGISADSARTYRMIALINWKTKSPETGNRITFPIHWKRERYFEDDTTLFHVYFPLYWAYEDMEIRNKVVFPFTWKFENSLYKSFTVPPFYSRGISSDSTRSYRMIALIDWKTKSPETGNRFTFPVHWKREKYFEDDTTLFHVYFPVYWAYKDMEINNRVVFPVTWKFENTLYKSFTVPPIYSCGISTDSTRSYRMIALIDWKTKSPEVSNRLTIPIRWKREKYFEDDTTLFRVYFPIYWAYDDMEIDNKVVFPFTWKFENTLYKSLTIPPLYSRGISSDSTRSYRMIALIDWKTKSPEASNRLFIPLYWKKEKYSEDDTSSLSTFFPLYWAYKNDKEKNKMLLPLIWSFKNEKSRSFTFAPIFSGGRSKEDKGKYLMLAMLYWQSDNDAKSKRTVFPLYWKRKYYTTEDTSEFKTIFPIYWANRDNSKNNKIVFPLIWSLKNNEHQSFTFAPIFSKGKSVAGSQEHMMISPLYWQFKSAQGQNKAFIPLYFEHKKFKQEDTTVLRNICGIYWSKTEENKSNKVLFPLVWSLQKGDYKSFTFIPLVSKGQSATTDKKHLMISPLYWQFESEHSKRQTFIPVYWKQENYSENDTSVFNSIFPVYWAKRDDSKNNKIVFPLVWKFQNDNFNSFTFLPFYSKKQSGDNNGYTAITPFFWKINKHGKSKTILFPFYNNSHSDDGEKKSNFLLVGMRQKKTGTRKTNHILWPFCESTRDSNYNYFRFAPVIWYKKTEDSKFFSIQPLYYVSKDSESKGHHILWQLYTSKNQFGYKKSKSFLWKVFYSDKYENKDHETRLLHLVYANVKKEGKTEKSIFPVIHSIKEANGDKSLSVLFYFYNKFQRRINDSDDFYKEEKIFWFIRLRSNYKQLQKEGKIEKRLS